MKLMFIGFMEGFGGAEKMLIMLANEVANRGHDISLVSLRKNNPKYEINDLVKYIFLPDRGNNKISIMANRYKDLKNIIHQRNPDLIINFWFQPSYFCAFMGKDIAEKTIYAERGDPFDKEYSGLMGIIRKISFKKLGGFVFQSKGAQGCFDESVKRRSCIIHNPVFINPEDYPIPTQRDQKVVTVGRLHPQKNQELLIEAFTMLPPDKDNYKLEIYGDGELKQNLQKKIDDLGLSHRVLLKGTFKDVHKRIADASLFVLSSDYEGMPNVLLEATTIGIPVLSTDCRPGGAREIIQEGVNGEIVPCGDANTLSRVMNNLLSHPEICEKYSIEGRKVGKRFLPEEIYTEWEDYFRLLVGSGDK